MAAASEEGVLQSLPVDDQGRLNVGLRDPATGKLYHPRRDVGGNLKVALYAADGTTALLGTQEALSDTGDRNAVVQKVGAVPLLDTGTVTVRARGSIANGMLVDVSRVTGTVTVDSEMAAAIAFGDAMGNPTTAPVIALNAGFDGTNAIRSRGGAVGATGVSASGFAMDVRAFPYLFDGATSYYAQRGIGRGTLLASAARIATTASAQQTLYNNRALRIYLNITIASGTGGLTLSIRGYDPISGTAYALDTDASAITTTGLFVFDLAPGNVSAGSAGVRRTLARIVDALFDVNVVHGDASSYTYSVAYQLSP